MMCLMWIWLLRGESYVDGCSILLCGLCVHGHSPCCLFPIWRAVVARGFIGCSLWAEPLATELCEKEGLVEMRAGKVAAILAVEIMCTDCQEPCVNDRGSYMITSDNE